MKTFFDYSFDGTISPEIDAGSLGQGTISQTGGMLQYSVASGNNDTNWYYNIQPQRGKRPYFPLGNLSKFRELAIESEINSFTTSDSGSSHANFMLWLDSSNCCWIYTHGSGNIYAYIVSNNSWNYLGGVGATFPVKVRFFWDLANKQLYYQYWNGSSWQNIISPRANTVNYTQVAWYLKCWNSAVTAAAEWSYIKIYGEIYDRIFFNESTDEPLKTSIEEHLNFPISTQGPTDRGIFLPAHSDIDVPGRGPKQAPLGSIEENSRIIEGNFLLTAFDSSPQSYPQSRLPQSSIEEKVKINRAASLASLKTTEKYLVPVSAAEEYLFSEIADPQTFSTYSDDEDGNARLGGLIVTDEFIYDTDSEPWATPSAGNGHYVYGRDGKTYYDGEEAGPTLNGTSFGTLLDGFNKKTWMIDAEPSAIGSNLTDKMQMSIESDDHVKMWSLVSLTDWGWSKRISSRHRWYLTGDFDIELSFENRNVSGGSDGFCPGFWLKIDDTQNYVFVRRHHDGDYDAGCLVNGSVVAYNSQYRPDASGKIRLTRTGNSYSGYYWDGSGWVNIMTTGSYAVNGLPIPVDIYAGGLGGLTISRIDIFGFTINSGTVINTAGWYRETSGSTRGIRSDFPEKAIIVSTLNSVDILDFSTNKLWMRFIAATNNALYSAAIYPRRVFMKNGVLLIATSAGGVIAVDFSLDEIRVHAPSGESFTGALLRAHNGVYWHPTAISSRDIGAAGIITSRNAAGGYYGDFNSYHIPSLTAHCVAIYEDSGYLYKISATASGIGVQRWQRFYHDGASPANTNDPYWFTSALTNSMIWCYVDPSDGTLFYFSPSTGLVYSVAKANWISTAKAGTFAADNSKSVPGTTNQTGFSYSQSISSLILNGGYLYRFADQGVYRCSWPSGSWEHFLGMVGSGATYSIFPLSFLGISAGNFCRDSISTLLMTLSCIFESSRYQTWIINPSTGGIYAKSIIYPSHQTALLNGAIS